MKVKRCKARRGCKSPYHSTIRTKSRHVVLCCAMHAKRYERTGAFGPAQRVNTNRSRTRYDANGIKARETFVAFRNWLGPRWTVLPRAGGMSPSRTRLRPTHNERKAAWTMLPNMTLAGFRRREWLCVGARDAHGGVVEFRVTKKGRAIQ